MKKKKYICFENEKYAIYSTDEMQVGQEADFSDEILEIALVGFSQFAQLLAEPIKFWHDAIPRIKTKVDDWLSVMLEESSQQIHVNDKTDS